MTSGPSTPASSGAMPTSRSTFSASNAGLWSSLRRGARWSTADAYLKPALQRKNLTLHTEAAATRVIFDGTRAVGVEFEQLDQRRMVHARREVVLCGGAINSPQLLMLSGIGAREQLAEHGIDVVRESPGVGTNLLDHLIAPLGFDVPNDTLFAAEKPLELVNS